MRFLEDSKEFVDFDLGVIVAFEVEHFLDPGDDLAFHLVVDQLIKGNILVLGHFIQHFEDLIENGELSFLCLFLQALEELLLAEIKEFDLSLADLVAGRIDVGDDLVWV